MCGCRATCQGAITDREVRLSSTAGKDRAVFVDHEWWGGGKKVERNESAVS